ESKSITILNNQSTSGTINFAPMVTIPTTYISRHIKIGDIDGDAKPDIAYASVDDGKNGIPASKISVIRNQSCMIPKLTPAETQIICTGSNLRLFSTESKGATYSWKNNGTQVATGSDPYFDIITSGNYTVTRKAEGATCSETSANTVTVTVSGSGVGLTGSSNARSNS